MQSGKTLLAFGGIGLSFNILYHLASLNSTIFSDKIISWFYPLWITIIGLGIYRILLDKLKPIKLRNNKKNTHNG